VTVVIAGPAAGSLDVPWEGLVGAADVSGEAEGCTEAAGVDSGESVGVAVPLAAPDDC